MRLRVVLRCVSAVWRMSSAVVLITSCRSDRSLQARSAKDVREQVLAAERLLLLETGFQVDGRPLHGEVAEACTGLKWPPALRQTAWNITSDRCAAAWRATAGSTVRACFMRAGLTYTTCYSTAAQLAYRSRNATSVPRYHGSCASEFDAELECLPLRVVI